MTEWTTTTRPVERTDTVYTTVVEGLQVEVEDHHGYISWSVAGYLDDIQIFATGNSISTAAKLAQMQDAAVSAARRLHALGVRAEKSATPKDPA
jgi:hypothetical protein